MTMTSPSDKVSGLSIFLDMDGVLADFRAGVAKLFKVQIGDDCPYQLNTIFGLTDKEFWYYIRQYEKFWQTLPVLPDAAQIVATCLRYADVYFLTNPSCDPGAYTGKLEWLQRHLRLTEEEAISSILVTEHKHLFASPNSILVDDLPSNVDRFRCEGGHAITYPAPWNEYKGLGYQYFDGQLRHLCRVVIK